MRLIHIWCAIRVIGIHSYGNITMITAGTYPPISIDLGKDEPGMTLQYRDIERGYIVWRDVYACPMLTNNIDIEMVAKHARTT